MSGLPFLTIIPAGAGSGKTHAIQQRLGEWVEQGWVAPERIVAVTFTESAAAELKGRIRARLLNAGRVEEALRLDHAYISTIHAFGWRLLREFAFDLGLSPALRLLSEDEESTFIRLAIARSSRGREMAGNLARFGYRFDAYREQDAETIFHDAVLDMVGRLRSIGRTADSPSLASESGQWVAQRFGPVVDGDHPTATLHAAVCRLLDNFPESLASTCGSSPTAKQEFNRDFNNLVRARERRTLASDWSLWQSLRLLRLSKRGSPVPEGYESLAGAVIVAAGEIIHHPGPRELGVDHAGILVGTAEEALQHHAESKVQAGVVDYSDMVALAHHLLDSRPEVLGELKARVDCVVIDEFQDTNPLQFSLLWKLHEAGVPALVVGDLKQAIMGFQLADPRLLAALEHRHPEARDPLTSNWRSSPGLLAFVNGVGAGLFGSGYQSLTPRGRESSLPPLDIIQFADKFKREHGSSDQVRPTHLAARLHALLDNGELTIFDRHQGKERPLRGGDVAVLCPTHKLLAIYADVLRKSGFSVRLQEEGWHASREVQIALAALAFVANPGDRHAALYLAVTELGTLTLEEGIRCLVSGEPVNDSLLTRLALLADQARTTLVPDRVDSVLRGMDLFRVISTWPRAIQARANLMRLQGEARAFAGATVEALANGGFHGFGIPTFLAWLQARRESDDKQPEPRVLEENAIRLMTWHSAKGREWPVVAMCGLDQEVKARLPHGAVGYSDFTEMTRLLERARIEFSPEFAAPETRERFMAPLQEAAVQEAKRLLYVALTRAREKLILEWPAYLDHDDRTTYWSILRDATGLRLDQDACQLGGVTHPCTVLDGGNQPHAEPPATGETKPESPLNPVGLRALTRRENPGQEDREDGVTATSLPEGMLPMPIQALNTASYGEGLVIHTETDAAALGTFLHLCWEILGQDELRMDRLAGYADFPEAGPWMPAVGQAVTDFETWVQRELQPVAISREIPFQMVNDQGQVITGTIDCLVETASGWWVIDHKSDRVNDLPYGFTHHWPQLSAYIKAVDGRQGKPVIGAGINWIAKGLVTWVQPTVAE